MLTSKEILELAGRSGAGARGAALFAAGKGKGGVGVGSNTEEQNKFLRDFAGAQARHNEKLPRAYAHPERAPSYSRKVGPLSAAELAWINRLPQDPSQVSHEDARVLAGIAATIGRLENPGDALIVDQVWKPIKEIHDRNAAEVRLAAAKVGIPPVPETAFGALVDAILAETNELTRDEAETRASQQLQEIRVRIRSAQESEVEAAEAALMAVDAREYSRTAVTL